MRKRFVIFGYKIENGEVKEEKYESYYVKKIYDKYLTGESFDKISKYLNKEKVIYYDYKCNWNKNKVKRILENKKYIGCENYTQIIEKKDFEAVQVKIKELAPKITKKDEVIEMLKTKIYCKRCNEKMVRKPSWSNREKWICKNGCKFNVYIDDKYLLSSLEKDLNNYKVKEISTNFSDSNSVKNNKNSKYENQIKDYLKNDDKTIIELKKCLYEYANERFKTLKENKSLNIDMGEYKNLSLKEKISLFNKIKIVTDGNVELE